MKLDELIDATRELQEPTTARTDQIYGRLMGSLGAPVTPEPLSPQDASSGGADVLSTASSGGASFPLWGKILLATTIGVGGIALVQSRVPPKEQVTLSPSKAEIQSKTSASHSAPLASSATATSESNKEEAKAEQHQVVQVQAPKTPPAAAPVRTSTKTQDKSADALRRQVELLRAAKGALNKKQPKQALTILDRYDRQFPSGTLKSEARATRVLALCALEQGGKAAEVGSQIEGDSPLAQHLGSGCQVPSSK